jgi:hypothetical protein
VNYHEYAPQEELFPSNPGLSSGAQFACLAVIETILQRKCLVERANHDQGTTGLLVYQVNCCRPVEVYPSAGANPGIRIER